MLCPVLIDVLNVVLIDVLSDDSVLSAPTKRPKAPLDAHDAATHRLSGGSQRSLRRLTQSDRMLRDAPNDPPRRILMSSIRTKLATIAAIAAAAVGGATIANAATSASTASSTTSARTQPGHPPRDHRMARHQVNGKTETLLTGDIAAKVKAAALAKVSGTVERVETNVDNSTPYEAHITKSDGTEVEV